MGHVATFKILPEGSKYTVKFVSAMTLEEPPLAIIPLNSNDGSRAYATQQVVAGLRNGRFVNGVLVCVMKGGARIFKPPEVKGTHKTWEDSSCIVATAGELADRGIALLCLMTTGKIRAFTIPSMKEIAEVDILGLVDRSRYAYFFKHIRARVFFGSPCMGSSKLILVTYLGLRRHI